MMIVPLQARATYWAQSPWCGAGDGTATTTATCALPRSWRSALHWPSTTLSLYASARSAEAAAAAAQRNAGGESAGAHGRTGTQQPRAGPLCLCGLARSQGAAARHLDNLSTWLDQDVHELLPPASQEHLNKLRRARPGAWSASSTICWPIRARAVYSTQLEQVDTRESVRAIFDLQAPPPEFQLTVGDAMPMLYTQRVPLETVLRNLIGNAIKHHQRADGHVRVSARPGGGVARVSRVRRRPGHEHLSITSGSLSCSRRCSHATS